jgi:hypothetical protein
MTSLRRYWLRAYPAIIAIWIVIVSRVLAHDVSAVDRAGQPPPSAAPIPPNEHIAEQVATPAVDSVQSAPLVLAAAASRERILSVVAPHAARRVTAYFPFGLVKPLVRDGALDQWQTRFHVPVDVKAGRYTVRLRVIAADGGVHWRHVQITIDATPPQLNVRVAAMAWAGELMQIAVDPLEPANEIYVMLPGVSPVRTHLDRNAVTGLYEGEVEIPLELPRDEVIVRVVAKDNARKRIQTELVVPVSRDGC